jgi:hypothetical protein
VIIGFVLAAGVLVVASILVDIACTLRPRVRLG